MGFYDLSKSERLLWVKSINEAVHNDFITTSTAHILQYFSDEDTYVRKNAYLAIGKIYTSKASLRVVIVQTLAKLSIHADYHVRQTVINSAGEIGKTDFEQVQAFFDTGLFDEHHAVRNAVIGSIKKMGQKNPIPTLKWANSYLYHDDKEIRREICHGIELRGRTHPQDILPMLKELQHDSTPRVRNTLIHVLGQISYKKGCLKTVIGHLNSWENKELVRLALDEIVDVHERYKSFAVLTQQQAMDYIDTYCIG